MMEQTEMKGATASSQPALVNQAPTGLGPSGFDRAQTLDEMEARGANALAAIRCDYYAGLISLAEAGCRAHDVERAVDKARDAHIRRLLSHRRAA
jgi:hypothetical protein